MAYIICALVSLKYITVQQSGLIRLPRTNIKKLQTGPNFACRIISSGKKRDHITSIFRIMGWLPVKKHLLYRDLVMTYKCVNGLAPKYLCEFHKRSELNNDVTRNNEADYIFPYVQPQQDREVFDTELLGYGTV